MILSSNKWKILLVCFTLLINHLFLSKSLRTMTICIKRSPSAMNSGSTGRHGRPKSLKVVPGQWSRSNTLLWARMISSSRALSSRWFYKTAVRQGRHDRIPQALLPWDIKTWQGSAWDQIRYQGPCKIRCMVLNINCPGSTISAITTITFLTGSISQ